MPLTLLPAHLPSLTPFPNVCYLQVRIIRGNAQESFQEKQALSESQSWGRQRAAAPVCEHTHSNLCTYPRDNDKWISKRQPSSTAEYCAGPGESAFFSPQGHGMLKGAGTNPARKTNLAIPNKFQLAKAEGAFAWTKASNWPHSK